MHRAVEYEINDNWIGSGGQIAAALVFVQSLGKEKWLELHSISNAKKTVAAWNYYRSLTSGVLLFKGWSISRFYDRSIRTYSDVDLAFDPKDQPLVLSGKEAPQSRGIGADLHFGFRGLDLLSWEDLYTRSYDVELDGVPVRVLSDEDNLRVTAVHWLTDGGVNKDRLWDIFYLVKNRRTDFDWERCLESNGPVRKTWVIAAIATARDHLDLDVSGLPGEVQEFVLPAWYAKTLEKEWERGPYVRRVMSSVITRPKLLAEQVHRRFPPNRIAATIDTETPIDESSRIAAQLKSLTNKIGPFVRGIGRRLSYRWHRKPR